MYRFRLQDLTMLEAKPTSPTNLTEKIGELLSHSLSSAARLELLDRKTGEYRLIIHGILDQSEGLPER